MPQLRRSLTITVVVLLMLVAVARCASGEDGGDGDGEWVRVTETELEGPGNDDTNGLSRRIQLNLTLSSRDVTLTLQRNDNVPSNVTVVVGKHGRLLASTINDVSFGQSAYYIDTENEASILVQVSATNGTQVSSYSGSFQVGHDRYVIESASSSSSPVTSRRRRRRNADTPPDVADLHIVFRRDLSQVPDVYEPAPLRLPAEASLWRSMARRERSNTLPTALANAVQLVLGVDYRLYSRFYNMSSGATAAVRETNTLNMIQSYFSHIVNGVDLRYRSVIHRTYSVSVQLVAYYVAITADMSQFVEENRIGTGITSYINAQPSLMRFIDFMSSNNDMFPSFDSATLVISEPMNGQTGNRIAGLAFFQAICTQYAATIIREAGEYATTQTITHELAHTLGCVHDELDNHCKAADMHIMVASPAPLTDDLYRNAFTFSTCSVDEMRHFLSILTQANSNCLLNRSGGMPSFPQLPPGQMFNPDVQCQLMLGVGAFYCAGESNDRQLCRSMKCYHPDFHYCYTTYEQRAFTGTTCGNRKWCQHGDCVSNSTAPQAPDVCVYNDSKIQLTDGMHCANVSSTSAWHCYDRSTADFCCRTCSTLRNTSRAGCEFGDKSPICQSVQLSNCSDSYINSTCCLLCASYRWPTTTTISTTIQPTPTSTVYIECPDGDRRSDCKHLIDAGAQCYTYAADCCATCARFKTNISTCEYGDRDTTCSSIKRVNCYRRSRTCCATCRALQNTNIPGCEWGDKTPGWCSSILDEQCYSVESTCCKTCHDRRSAEPGCKYGDHSRQWCTSTIRYLHHCYSYREYCCGTCNYYKTGPKGCEWGDRKLSCNRRRCDDPAEWTPCCRTCSTFIPPPTTTTTTTTTTTSPTTTTTTTTTTPPDTTTTSTTTTSTTTTPTTPKTVTIRPTTPTTTKTTTTTLPTTTETTTTTTLPPTTTTSTAKATARTKRRHSKNTQRKVKLSTTTTNPATTVSKQDDCAGDIAWWCTYIQATDCYEASRTCCRTCEQYRKPIPGCEFGDHYWWCSQGNYCYNDFLRNICCITCRTFDKPTCRDHSTACSATAAVACYNRITRTNCCQTCSKFNTGISGCEYGDRQTWCYDISRSECSFYQNDCCETCS